MVSAVRKANVNTSQKQLALAGARALQLELLVSQLRERLQVAVIFGGNKKALDTVVRQGSNPRSWKSYESVAEDIASSLRRIGIQSVATQPEGMQLGKRLRDGRINIAWLNTGGVQGRSAISHAAATLEMLGIPYIGHDPLTAALLDSKHHFKRQLIALGIPTAPFLVCHTSDAVSGILTDRYLKSQFGMWPHGFVVKPVTGRASLHVHYVERAAGLAAAVRHVLNATQTSVMIEAFVPGREYCIAVSGPWIAKKGRLQQLPHPFAFSAVERVLEPGEHIFTSMDTKPITTARVRQLTAGADRLALTRLESIARQVYIETPLNTLVRLDVRADQKGNLFVLEVNPKPDLKAPGATTSLICAGLSRYGMSYDDLVLSVFADRIATLFDDRAGSIEQFFQSFKS
jgi:D-alanine-D-alanine ligase